MSIKSDHWIRRMAREHGMIEPFAPEQVRYVGGQKIVSYGTSSYGYDVRCADEFKIFTNINSTIVDPKAFDEKSFVDLKSDVCVIPPNSFALARTVEYFRIPRSVLTICLGKSTYARCFRGDTRVALIDGEAPTLEDMARRHESGERFWGYGVDPSGRIIAALLDRPRFIGRDALLEIELDNGERIQATADHQFMRRDGRMAEAHLLRPGDALMPLYREIVRGHEEVYQPIDGFPGATHHLADEWNVRHDIYADVPGAQRHHIDRSRRNNRPTNFGRSAASERSRLHGGGNDGEGFAAKEHAEAIYAALARRAADPRWRARYPNDSSGAAQRFAMPKRYAAPAEHERQVWRSAADSRRRMPAEVARRLELREQITADRLSEALHATGSMRGAAALLRRDRSDLRGTPAYRNHKVTAVRELPGEHDVYCVTVPEAGNFALQAGVFVHNCGIIVNVTPLEPEWEGHVTLEFSNTTPLPAKIYANEGVAQMLFFESDEVCLTSYKDRGGKYQGQRGVTLPKT